MNAEEIIRLLGLEPLEREGGYFAETYRSAARTGERSLATAIYYLITVNTFSALHRLPGDEIFHFYLGDPVELVLFAPDGSVKTLLLGPDIAAGMRPQVVVPGGTWQGASLVAGGAWALLGTTMSPGFDIADFELGERETLAREYPRCAEVVRRLTRPDPRLSGHRALK